MVFFCYCFSCNFRYLIFNIFEKLIFSVGNPQRGKSYLYDVILSIITLPTSFVLILSHLLVLKKWYKLLLSRKFSKWRTYSTNTYLALTMCHLKCINSWVTADSFLCCAVKFPCPPTRPYRCRNNRVCLRPEQICNEVDDCGDNSDEDHCGRWHYLSRRSDHRKHLEGKLCYRDVLVLQ